MRSIYDSLTRIGAGVRFALSIAALYFESPDLQRVRYDGRGIRLPHAGQRRALSFQ